MRRSYAAVARGGSIRWMLGALGVSLAVEVGGVDLSSPGGGFGAVSGVWFNSQQVVSLK